MAQLIKDTGETLEISPANGKRFQLYELKGFVEGDIELVTLADGRLMYVNEDGKYDDKIKHRHNAKATELFHLAGGLQWDFVTGNVVICKKKES